MENRTPEIHIIKYTVIIPVYNAEKTLRRCLDSLLSLHYLNAEILLVNDGSQDDSGMICREYEKENECVRYFEKENCGVSSARNMGLDRAIGQYILFVDSDDCVATDFFTSIDSLLEQYDFDLIQFSNSFMSDKTKKDRVREEFQAKARADLFSKLIETIYKKKSNQPWAKVFKREIIEAHNIRFPKNVEVGEDRAFFIHYSFFINSYCISSTILYCVSIENAESLSRKHRNDLDIQSARINNYVRDAAVIGGVDTEEWSEYQKALNYDQLRMVYAKAKTLHKEGLPLDGRVKEIRKYCRDINDQSMAFPNTIFCRLTSFPVRKELAFVIDAITWILTH